MYSQGPDRRRKLVNGSSAGTIRPVPSLAPPDVFRLPTLAVPAWASHLPGTRLATVRVPAAADLSAAALAAAVAAAFAELLSAGRRHPVRFWNFLPGINDPLGDAGQTRYMAFNAGRLAAFDRCPAARAATASAVGHAGPDLHLHCLSADRPGAPVDNPRQVQPHRYSARYGRRPPCFARASRIVIGGRRLLLVGGTASVVGEDSVHADLPGQIRETLANLAAVAGPTPLTAVRAYHVPYVDPTQLRDMLPPTWAAELVPADVCRPELLVEIEALGEDPA